MARFDSADLLASLRRELRRPTQNDTLLDDPTGYEYLSQAQEKWLRILAALKPEINYGPPLAMATADGGLTYTFTGADGAAVDPIGHVEVYATLTGPPLTPGAFWDLAADFVHEGDRIRFPGGRVRTFGTGGPWARFVDPRGVISASAPPVLKPVTARVLLPLTAAALFAEGPGKQDPAPFEAKAAKLWAGDPSMGDYGILGEIRTKYLGEGAATDSDRWQDGLWAERVGTYTRPG